MRKNIAIQYRPYQRTFLLLLAQEIKRVWEANIHFYVNNEQDRAHLMRTAPEGLATTISIVDHLTDMSMTYLNQEPERLHREAETLERDYGLGINEMTVSNRHFGRGFALAGFHHMQSQMSRRLSYDEIVSRYVASLNFWIAEFATKDLDLIINGPDSAYFVARKNGVPYRALIESRLRNRYMWAVDRFDTNPEIEANFSRIVAAEATDEALMPPEGHLQFRASFLDQVGLLPILKRNMSTLIRYAYWRLRGYAKADGYRISDRLKAPWLFRNAFLQCSGAQMATLSQIKDQPYVFYPLHAEPEKSLQALSPEYFFQLETIAAIARDLPTGVKLVVKEHLFALGRRPRDYYGQIRAFKNVVFVDVREFGLELVRHAKAVVTISSTAGLEACYLGKPVITFGQHNMYNFMDNVRVLSSPQDLRSALLDALRAESEGRYSAVEGERLKRAIQKSSFDMGGFTEMAMDDIETDAIDEAFSSFVQSVQEFGAWSDQAEAA